MEPCFSGYGWTGNWWMNALLCVCMGLLCSLLNCLFCSPWISHFCPSSSLLHPTRREWMSGFVGLSCWLGLNHNNLFKFGQIFLMLQKLINWNKTWPRAEWIKVLSSYLSPWPFHRESFLYSPRLLPHYSTEQTQQIELVMIYYGQTHCSSMEFSISCVLAKLDTSLDLDECFVSKPTYAKEDFCYSERRETTMN